jgi:hypothetical protein
MPSVSTGCGSGRTAAFGPSPTLAVKGALPDGCNTSESMGATRDATESTAPCTADAAAEGTDRGGAVDGEVTNGDGDGDSVGTTPVHRLASDGMEYAVMAEEAAAAEAGAAIGPMTARLGGGRDQLLLEVVVSWAVGDRSAWSTDDEIDKAGNSGVPLSDRTTKCPEDDASTGSSRSLSSSTPCMQATSQGNHDRSPAEKTRRTAA